MPTQADEALCIRVWDWSETSQTVSLFCRSLGVLRGLAKGSKRDHAKFSGGLDILTRGHVVAITKSNESLATLTSWDLLEIFPAARRSLSAFYISCYMLDLVHHAVRDADPHPTLYDSLLAALRLAQNPAHAPAALLLFQWSALIDLGYMPDLYTDIRSAAPLAEAPGPLAFDPRRGGFTSSLSAEDAPWRVRPETLQLLRSLKVLSPSRAESAPQNHRGSSTHLLDNPLLVEHDGVTRANRLLGAYFRELLGVEPSSLAAALAGRD